MTGADDEELEVLAPLPARNWVEKLRRKLPEGTRRRKIYDVVALPVDPPREFLMTESALRARLRVPDSVSDDEAKDRSADVLAQAQEIFQTAEDRANGVTTRATALQGAVAIATSLLLAGAGLVLDQTKLYGDGWRVGFAVLLIAVTGSLVMAGLRALSATSTIHAWHRPTIRS